MNLERVVGLIFNVTHNNILTLSQNFKENLTYLGFRMLKDQSAQNF